jgi:hypothetical protein
VISCAFTSDVDSDVDASFFAGSWTQAEEGRDPSDLTSRGATSRST